MSASGGSSSFSAPSPIPTLTGPKTFGEILDRVFQLLRSNLRLLLGIAAVPAGACLVLYVVFLSALWLSGALHQSPKGPDPQAAFRIFLPAMLALCIPLMAVFAIYMAATSYAATQADTGVRVTLRESYSLAWGRVGRYVLLLVWIYLRAFWPVFVIFLPLFVGGVLLSVFKGTGANPAWFLAAPVGVLLYLGAYVYSIIVALRLSLAFPACVVEGLTARVAIQRSSQLTQGANGRIFLMLLLVYVISYALFIALYLVAAVLFAVVGLGTHAMQLHLTPPWNYIVLGFGGLFAAAAMFLWISLTWAGLTTSLAVIYNDQRVRKEGYDIERMMQAAGLTAPPTPIVESGSPQA